MVICNDFIAYSYVLLTSYLFRFIYLFTVKITMTLCFGCSAFHIFGIPDWDVLQR